MFSMLDFSEEEIWAVQGSLGHLSEQIEAGEVKPRNREWKENEQKERVEHLQWIIKALDKVKHPKDDEVFKGFAIGSIAVSFDIQENDILAIYAACRVGHYLLNHNEQVIASVGKEKAADLLPVITSALSRLKNIGAADHAIDLVWKKDGKNVQSKSKIDIPDFTVNDTEIQEN